MTASGVLAISQVMENPREYLEAFIERTAAARIAAEYTQEQIAHKLGLNRGTYAQYERATQERITTLPMNLVPMFCQLTGISIEYLLTGREHPVIAAYNATTGDDRRIIDKFLRLQHDDPSLKSTAEEPHAHP